MPFVSVAKKEEVWAHMLSLPRPGGMTDVCLARVKSRIFVWDYFWQDVVVFHGLLSMTPEELKVAYLPAYNHAVGNFWGMVAEVVRSK